MRTYSSLSSMSKRSIWASIGWSLFRNSSSGTICVWSEWHSNRIALCVYPAVCCVRCWNWRTFRCTTTGLRCSARTSSRIITSWRKLILVEIWLPASIRASWIIWRSWRSSISTRIKWRFSNFRSLHQGPCFSCTGTPASYRAFMLVSSY